VWQSLLLLYSNVVVSQKTTQRRRLPMSSDTPQSVFYGRGNLIPHTLGTPYNLMYVMAVLFIFGPLLAAQITHLY